MHEPKSEIRDGMQIDWDAPIAMDDGVVLRADVFRPVADGRYPVILSYGPYAKGLAFQEGYKSAWLRMTTAYPETAEGSSNKYQNWELVDPEKWVPDGYAVVRVDSRGAGRSPGHLEVWSPREAKDLHDCVEWAGTQPWSNGKVGINGISYYAMNQWHVAPLQAAASRRTVYLGRLLRLLPRAGAPRRHPLRLFDELVAPAGDECAARRRRRGPRSPVTGEPVAGPPTLAEEELACNRADVAGEAQRRRLIDDYYRARTPAFEQIDVPLLSAANWGGQGLHPRGNFEGYLAAGSQQKWLEVHGDTHFSHFYTDYGAGLQKRFFGHFLKGEDTGWEKQPPVSLNIRRPGEMFTLRAENEWPLARTQWTRFYLHAGRPQPARRATEADGDAALRHDR